MSIITSKNLTIGYTRGKRKKLIQKHLNLNATEGEFIALIGPNGCGKSTLLKTLSGLLEVLEGEVFIEGKNIKKISLNEKAKMYSIVLTDNVNVGYITVFQMVAMGRHPYTTLSGALTEEDKKIINQSLESVNISSMADNYLHELSDGERQRVMIAKALAQTTKIIMLDEPTSHLDLSNRIETMILLKNLAKQTGKTILISTHEIDMALRLADNIWLMKKEEGLVSGKPEDLISQGILQSVFKSDSFGFEKQTGRVIIY